MQGARLQPCGTPSPKSRAGLVPVAGVSSQTGQCLAEQWPVRMWRLWVRIRSDQQQWLRLTLQEQLRWGATLQLSGVTPCKTSHMVLSHRAVFSAGWAKAVQLCHSWPWAWAAGKRWHGRLCCCAGSFVWLGENLVCSCQVTSLVFLRHSL